MHFQHKQILTNYLPQSKPSTVSRYATYVFFFPTNLPITKYYQPLFNLANLVAKKGGTLFFICTPLIANESEFIFIASHIFSLVDCLFIIYCFSSRLYIFFHLYVRAINPLLITEFSPQKTDSLYRCKCVASHYTLRH